MINKIIKGISQALYSEFGEEYNIYTEDVEQGLREPCFFVQCINPKITRFCGNQYFPKSKDYRAECFSVIDRMYKALEFIELDSEPLLGKGIDTNIYDGVLTLTINYDIFVIVENDVEKMEILIQKGMIKNGN